MKRPDNCQYETGGKERSKPLRLQGLELLTVWLAEPGIADNPAGPLFLAARSAPGLGRHGFRAGPMSIPAVEKLIERYVVSMGLARNITVHSLKVTVLTTARERGIGYHRRARRRRAR